MRWDVLKGRSTTWSFCVRGADWTLTSQDERHTFFGHTDVTTYTCPHFTFWSSTPSSPYECTRPDTTERGTELVAGAARVRVGHRSVATVHLHRTSAFTGGTRGTSTYDFWLDRGSGVPVRIVMVSRTTNDSAVGAVHYGERVVLRLTSLTPRR
jgi:hypothetical protein